MVLRVGPASFGLAAGGIAAAVLLVAAVLPHGPGPAEMQAARIVAVTPKPLSLRLSVIGAIEPGSVVNIVGPFDGVLRDKLFDYGGRVERGQKLAAMDASELEVRLREAEAMALKAARAVEDLKNWGNSPDVARAKRSVMTAKIALAETARKAEETKALLERGIVPRVEYDSLVQQAQAGAMQLAAAKQDLDSSLDKASPENRRIAELELENAQSKLDELKRQLAGGIILAPVSGLVLRPPAAAAGQTAAALVEAGSRVVKGQTMFSIANLETLAVTAKVDEVDVNRVAEGQAVEVTGDAFGDEPLNGRITRISAQALPGGGGAGRGASFEIVVEVPKLTDEQRQRIRVGMSSNLAIALYDNPQAIVLPAEAVHRGEEGFFVWVKDPQSGEERQSAVMAGQSVEDGVEIRSGLREGDLVVVR